MIITLIRTNGLGDVCMALCAAKALRMAGATVNLQTDPQYADLARACPHINEVYTTWDASRPGAIANLCSAAFGIPDQHQVDAFLAPILPGPIPDEHKTLDLDVPLGGRFWLNPGRSIVLLHPATGDPNRTWPIEHWRELAGWLVWRGYSVVQVGSNRHEKGVDDLRVAGVVDLRDQTDFLDFVSLCRSADLLVSSDGGPIQLAGATDIPIVGLYTVVRGRNRRPFRTKRFFPVESPCPHFPCYERLAQPGWSDLALRRIQSGAESTNSLFQTWCPAYSGHQCDITVPMVQDAIKGIINFL